MHLLAQGVSGCLHTCRSFFNRLGCHLLLSAFAAGRLVLVLPQVHSATEWAAPQLLPPALHPAWALLTRSPSASLRASSRATPQALRWGWARHRSFINSQVVFERLCTHTRVCASDKLDGTQQQEAGDDIGCIIMLCVSCFGHNSQMLDLVVPDTVHLPLCNLL